MGTLTVRSERVVTPVGVHAATIHIHDGRIVRVGPYEERPASVREIDAGSDVVMPGVVDTHVHINEPGRTEWEGFETATRAAAAGGVTTLVDMPLNSVPATTSVEGLDAKRQAARARCHVDVGFWGGVVPGNVADLEPLARAGVLGFKCFLSPSGVDEFRHVTEADLRSALPVLARVGLPLLAHAELPSFLHDIPAAADPRAHATWLDSRPAAAEVAAIDLLVRIARESGAHVHIVHLAAAEALLVVRAARASGVRITVETCPHYLTFAAEKIADGATALKCAPPIREGEQREALWRALVAGEIDLVATDHSPAPPSLKQLDSGDFVAAWGGIASLQVGLAAVWTGAAARRIPIERVSDWVSGGPARLAGLDTTKGVIASGYDADLIVFDSDAEWIVEGAALHHRHSLTPYDGMRVRGKVKTTILRGETIFEAGEFLAAPRGRLIARPFQVHSAR